ncbi:MAG: hypothetical protein KKG69_01750 [Alphaproteobacteria bacterium]|nr:hypothetical protein [Alphaproteobacteria bacterium]MBU2229983.1 hypothetical protein [Alphaproteobacteria bacterium]
MRNNLEVLSPETAGKVHVHPEETVIIAIDLIDGTVLLNQSISLSDHEGHQYGRVWTFRDLPHEQREKAVNRLRKAV